MSNLSVVVVNYASSEYLPRLFASLTVPHQLIVVDNFSTVQERETVSSILPAGALLVQQPNNGFAAGINAGARATAQGSYLLAANPDAWFGDSQLAQFMDSARRAELDLASPRILTPDGRIWFEGGFIRSFSGEVVHRNYGQEPSDSVGVRDAKFLSGCVLLISPRARGRLLPMREDLFMYYEDAELSARAIKEGDLTLGVVMDAVAFHDEGSTSGGGRGQRSRLYYYFQSRNRLRAEVGPRVAARSAATLLVLARVLVRILRDEREQRASKMWAAIGGSLAGLKDVVESGWRR